MVCKLEYYCTNKEKGQKPSSIHSSPSFHIFYASFHKDITYEKLQDETTKHFPIINLSNK